MKTALAVVIGLLSLASAWATDPQMSVTVSKGSYAAIAVVTGSSVAGTAFIGPDAKRMDGILFNNTATAIWISTISATQHIAIGHDANRTGLPVLASATFTLGGALSDALYFTCNSGAATCEVRVMEGKIR